MRTKVSTDFRSDAGDLSDPEDGAEAAAAQARHLVESYLASFADETEHLGRLAGALTARTIQRCRSRPERDLVETALEEAEGDLTAWSLFVLGHERVGAHSAVLVARAAYRACGGGKRWPGVLLRYDLPDGFVDAMRAAAPLPTPPERPGRMVLQPLETWTAISPVAPRLWNRLVSVFAGTLRV